MNETKKALAKIIPGKNYVNFVEVTENDGTEVRFYMQSYIVGMYAAIHFKGASTPIQTGDHDNKRFMRGLKKDLEKAIKRGAKIEFGSIIPVKKFEDEKPAARDSKPK
jgi:hypothetical protein